MPIYEYECRRCARRLEIMRRLSDPPLTECPECGGELRKLVSAPAFHLKGSGWYVTDYARKGGEGGTKEAAADKGGEAKAGGDDKAGDAKAGDGKGGETKATTKETASSSPSAGGAAGSAGGAPAAGSK